MNIIENKQQLAAAMAMTDLPAEYKNKLSAWWCRAQKPGRVYVISYDDAEDLCKQIDAHTEKASKRSQSRLNRGAAKTKHKQSEAEKCLAVISELADVYDVSVNDLIKRLPSEQRKKADEAAQQAAEKVNAFRSEHAGFFEIYEALQAELRKHQERSNRLYIIEQYEALQAERTGLETRSEEQIAKFSLTFSIAERLKTILKEKGIKQRELAIRLGKYDSEVSQWLSGRHSFSLSTIVCIEMAIGAKLIKIAE